MAVIEFHSHLKQQQNQAELAEQLEGLLGGFRKKRRPVRRPDEPERRRPERDAGKDLTDGGGLSQFASEPAKEPRQRNDDQPLQEHHFGVGFDGSRVHEADANTRPNGKQQALIPTPNRGPIRFVQLGARGGNNQVTTMQTNNPISLKRACGAIQIPAGTNTTLPEGTEVQIKQTLGGSYTVHAPGGLFRIAPQDADALGFEAAVTTGFSASSGEANELRVWDTLRTCFDPEIPVNIVDLGLVYDMKLSRQPNGGARVEVRMTLTAPGCGMGPAIAGDAQIKLLNLPGIEDAHVEIVWDPPWHHSMISPEGRKTLGLE